MVHKLLYIPNLIDYLRVLLLFLGVYYYRVSPSLFLSFYISSQLLDAADGAAARALNQWMILDMTIDRISYMLINSLNAFLYPEYCGWFILLIVLDSVSHLAVVSGSILKGGATHKIKSEECPWVLRIYYGTSALFCLCVCSEGFSVICYVGYHYVYTGFLSWVYIGMVGVLFAGTVLKQVTNFYHLELAVQFYNEVIDNNKGD